MKELVIDLDFMIGPITKDVYDTERNELCTGIKVVDSDQKLARMNEKIQAEFSALYEFDQEEAVTFDLKQAREKKEGMLVKVQELLQYLNSVNDGSFIVVDRATEYLKQL